MIFKLGGYAIEMIQNEKYAEDLQESVLIINTEEIVNDSTESDAGERDEAEKIPEIVIPKSVDFASLYTISDDAVAWIYDPV